MRKHPKWVNYSSASWFAGQMEMLFFIHAGQETPSPPQLERVGGKGAVEILWLKSDYSSHVEGCCH